MRKLLLNAKLIVLMLAMHSGIALNAQNVASADVQFELQAYELAVDSYLSIVEISGYDEHIALHLAKSYEALNDVVNAARWYDKLFDCEGERKDEEKIAYGKILRSIGLYDQAKEMFNSCSKSDREVELLIAGCDYATENLKGEDLHEVFLHQSSSTGSDFAPSLWKDQLLFSSFGNESNADKDFSIIHSEYNNLVLSEKDRRAKETTLEKMGSSLFEVEGISSCNFSADGTKVLYTRNHFKNPNRQIWGNEKNFSIYMASVDENGNFFNEYPLPFNSTDYACAFACFGENDKTIYFSSNKEGNHSQFDIYKSEFEEGKWSAIEKLKGDINTEGNEVSPFYVNGRLYFSSDLHPGLGGYDVFYADKKAAGWSEVFNLGKGVNSIADDLYLVTSENNEYFYTSNRLGGKGKYDIYVSLDKIQQEIPVEELAMHVMDKSEIPPAVSLVDMEVNSSVELTESTEAMAVSENEIIMEDEMISLEGAVMISQGSVILTNSQVYFIQVASLSKVSNNNAPFRRLVEFGNVYRVKKNRSYKIRLGYYPDEREAEKVLSKVRNIGFKDAFLVVEELDVKNLELLMSSFNFHKTGEFVKSEEESEYKIRLAAYSNPLYFDTEKVKDIGVIEQWSKDKWTIFLISGYKNMEEAQAARIKAINRGFKGAEIVLDKGGVLERVKSN